MTEKLSTWVLRWGEELQMRAANEKQLAEAMKYLESKVAIGLILNASIMRHQEGNRKYILVQNITPKIWKEVLEPEIRRLVPVEKVEFGSGIIFNVGGERNVDPNPFVKIIFGEEFLLYA